MADCAVLQRGALQVARFSLLGLLAMMVLTTVVVPSGGRAPNWTICALVSTPLLLLLWGVLRGSVTAHIWASFVSLLYFTLAVINLFSPRRSLFDGFELLLSIALFVAAMLYARWRSRALRAATEV